MKEEALSLVRDVADPAQRLNLLREYLQALVLRSLHESEAFLYLSFVGGTALRFLYNLPRFSEDLDFSLENPDGYEGAKWAAKVKRDLHLAAFDVAVIWNDRKTDHVAWVRIGGLLRDAGLAAVADLKLSVKFEIDTRPPEGAVCATDLVNRHRLLSLRHHDLASQMSGKVHALLTWPYPKGRDWYDLVWYRARRPPVEPNPVLLQNALDQTEGDAAPSAARWKEHVLDRLLALDPHALARGVEPLLEHPSEARLLTPEHIRTVLE